jgi:DNA-binding MarR family transcriptional regulator
VDRLERLNLARRSHARDDRRKIMVKPTEEGCALMTTVRDDMVGNLLKMMDALEPSEQRAWLCIYEKIFALCQKN